LKTLYLSTILNGNVSAPEWRGEVSVFGTHILKDASRKVD